MKLAWADVKEVFQEYIVWAHGQEMAWFEQVWRLLDRKGLTVWNSTVEKMAVYNRIYGIVWIFRGFCMAALGEDLQFDFCWEAPFQLSLKKMEHECAEAERVFDLLICDQQVVPAIFDILKEHLGFEQLFASLWATCCPEEIENDEDSVEETLTLIMNENLEAEKHAAYEWLSGYCG